MDILTTLTQFAQYYSSDYSYSSGAGGAVAFFVLFVLVIFTLAAFALYAYFLMRIFKKAGLEGWMAWVPVYNSWKLLELGKQPGYWAILAFVPLINIAAVVFYFIAAYHIGRNLQKDGAFVLLAIFLPIVWFIWLGIDKSTWKEVAA